MCLKAFIVGHLRLMQHMRSNMQVILSQVGSSISIRKKRIDLLSIRIDEQHDQLGTTELVADRREIHWQDHSSG